MVWPSTVVEGPATTSSVRPCELVLEALVQVSVTGEAGAVHEAAQVLASGGQFVLRHELGVARSTRTRKARGDGFSRRVTIPHSDHM